MDLEVVCISTELPEAELRMIDCYCIHPPQFGIRYHVREFVHNIDNTYGVLLREIVNGDNIICHENLHYNSGEHNWPMKNFKILNHDLRLKYKNLWQYYKEILKTKEIQDASPAIEPLE